MATETPHKQHISAYDTSDNEESIKNDLEKSSSSRMEKNYESAKTLIKRGKINSMPFSPKMQNSKRDVNKIMSKENSQNNQSMLMMHDRGQTLVHAPGHETSTEKLLLSNDKVTVKDLWQATPMPDFSDMLIERIQLDNFIEEASRKATMLKTKIDKRKVEQKQKEQMKEEEKKRSQEVYEEQRRMKIEQ